MGRRYIKHNNYQGYDRRDNNMKVKDFVTPTTIVTLIVGLIL